MGSFSWLRADRLTRVANIYYWGPYKFLIPKEFGGGFIKDHYQDYGYLGTKEEGGPKYDMYELLAFWNSHVVTRYSNGEIIADKLEWYGKENGTPMPFLKEIDQFTDKNRGYGIDIGCYDRQIKKLKFPLKLVSVRNTQTYEDCEGISLGDPWQGWGQVSWKTIDKEREEREKSYEEDIKKEVAERVDMFKKSLKAMDVNDPDYKVFEKYVEHYAKTIEEGIRSRYE